MAYDKEPTGNCASRFERSLPLGPFTAARGAGAGAAARPCELGGGAGSCGCLPCARAPRLSSLFVQLVYWCVMCVVDEPRRRVFTGAALTCLTRRRCRTALFTLRTTATSGPFFRCAVVLQNEDSQPLITLSYTAVAASAVSVSLAISKYRLLPFLRAALLAVLLPSCRRALSCAA